MKKEVSETEIARFFRLFHDHYPTSLSRKQRAEIRAIAAKVLSRNLTWEEGLAAAGIPIESNDAFVAPFDDTYRFFVWIMMFLFVSTAFGAFPDSKQEKGPNIAPEDQNRIVSAFRDTFEAPIDEEPEMTIPVRGKPVPVLGSPDSAKKPKRRSRPRRKGSRTETAAESKARPGGRATRSAKGKRRSSS